MTIRTNIFDELLAKAVMSGKLPARTEEARAWFRKKAQAHKPTKDILRQLAQSERAKKGIVIGKMYMFSYDPKLKKELPYYDTLPVVFPIHRYHNGFLGINFHYLPYPYRAKLMDALYTVANNQKFDLTTKLRISYGILKGASKYRFFKPCVKRYLWNHVRSNFMEIYSAEWDIAIMLPIARFKKASVAQVWKESLQNIAK